MLRALGSAKNEDFFLCFVICVFNIFSHFFLTFYIAFFPFLSLFSLLPAPFHVHSWISNVSPYSLFVQSFPNFKVFLLFIRWYFHYHYSFYLIFFRCWCFAFILLLIFPIFQLFLFHCLIIISFLPYFIRYFSLIRIFFLLRTSFFSTSRMFYNFSFFHSLFHSKPFPLFCSSFLQVSFLPWNAFTISIFLQLFLFSIIFLLPFLVSISKI